MQHCREGFLEEACHGLHCKFLESLPLQLSRAGLWISSFLSSMSVPMGRLSCRLEPAVDFSIRFKEQSWRTQRPKMCDGAKESGKRGELELVQY